jgi:predicted nucleic acid-binding protein
MDAFLAAWAKTSGLAYVTFDTGFKSYQLENLQLLDPQARPPAPRGP